MGLDELKSLVRAGQFGAITLDTSIFVSQGLRLESGLLKQLEQFRDSSTRLIISEVIREEALLHLAEKTKEAQTQLEKSLKKAKDYWQVESNEIEDIKKLVFDGCEAQEIASRRFGQFIKSTSLELIEAKSHLEVGDLLQKYFRRNPPFSEKKKYEFPDAIALMSLETWADKNQTKIIVVTSDNDWKNFCEASERLFSTCDLAEALSLFQLQDADDICTYLSEKYMQGALEKVKEALFSALESRIHEIDIDPEINYSLSDSDCNGEVTRVNLNGFEFKVLESPNLIFRPINSDSSLTVEAKLIVDINVECNFTFYTPIKRSYVMESNSLISTQADLEVEVVVAFVGSLDKIGAEAEVEEVEVFLESIVDIDFGDI
jgi:hypothetical protein